MNNRDALTGAAAPLPYVAAPFADLAAADRAAADAARRWGLDEPVRIRAAMSVIYRAGDAVLRISRPTARLDAGLDLMRTLANAGVSALQPVRDEVIVLDDTDLQDPGNAPAGVTAWPYIEPTRSVSPDDWEQIGATLARLHALPSSAFPPDYPRPSPTAFPWWNFDSLLADIATDTDASAVAAMRRVVDAAQGWDRFDSEPDTSVVCHGDVHRFNVLLPNGGPVLIDWDLLATAPPQFDHAVLLGAARNWGGDPADYRAFAAGYGRDYSDDELALTLVDLRDVAATALRVRAGRTDPAAATEARRRLRWWQGDPDAPTWAMQ